jgi:hypothetical protein
LEGGKDRAEAGRDEAGKEGVVGAGAVGGVEGVETVQPEMGRVLLTGDKGKIVG